MITMDLLPAVRGFLAGGFEGFFAAATTFLIARLAAAAATRGCRTSGLDIENGSSSSLSTSTLLLIDFRGLAYSHLCLYLLQFTQAPPDCCFSHSFPLNLHF